MDLERIVGQLIRALRGKRSQRQLSRALGYRSNVLYLWESCRRAPTLGELHRLAQRSRVDVPRAWATFFRVSPAAFGDHDSASAEFSAAVLGQLRGNRRVNHWAEETGVSRFTLARWLRGQGQPRLPILFRLVHSGTRRLPELLTAFVSAEELPAVAPAIAALARRRRVAVDQPWSQAVMRALELEDYHALPGHEHGWLGRRLGIDREQEQRCLDALFEAGLIDWTGSRYISVPQTLDLGPQPFVDRKHVKRHWSQVGIDRLTDSEEGDGNYYSFNVMNLSRDDLQRLRELHVRYFEEMRAIVAQSEPAEVVTVANLQLFTLADA